MSLNVLAVLALGSALLMTPSGLVADGPAPDTLSAWDQYVRAAEAKLDREWIGKSASDFRCPDRDAPTAVAGTRVAVSGGTVHDWRGCLLIPGARLETVVAVSRRPVRQEGVLDARVLEDAGDALRVYLKLVRRSLVTAVYSTEHEVEYRRHSPTLVTSRAIAVRIRELRDVGTPDERERPAGEDRGFLWRMNAYWRFEQVASGVVVELDSMTLSRPVPAIVRPLAVPIMNRVARESILQALEALRTRAMSH